MNKVKITFSEKDIPRRWYNIQADLPSSLYPPVHPAVKKPSSSKLTKSGRDILKKHPHSFGSLDIAISEAVKDAGGHVEKLCISPECG
ncbi:MAG: hypothetical protein B1H08_00145 [Candidatus Omnitrophica bacterium 4484_171]|nr:MAG: hypothetical protein B1H08_00145 [Candidatus Omnitrophica bacterium 4484_171]